MKNLEVLELTNRVSTYLMQLKQLKGAKFSYAIVKNFNILEKEVKDINSTITPSEDYKSYEADRIALCEKFAKKDELGNSIKKNIQANGAFEYDLDVTDKTFIEEIRKLQEKYKTALEDQSKKIEEYHKFLQEESEILFHTVSLDDIPSDISVELMSVIEPFIKN